MSRSGRLRAFTSVAVMYREFSDRPSGDSLRCIDRRQRRFKGSACSERSDRCHRPSRCSRPARRSRGRSVTPCRAHVRIRVDGEIHCHGQRARDPGDQGRPTHSGSACRLGAVHGCSHHVADSRGRQSGGRVVKRGLSACCRFRPVRFVEARCLASSPSAFRSSDLLPSPVRILKACVFQFPLFGEVVGSDICTRVIVPPRCWQDSTRVRRQRSPR